MADDDDLLGEDPPDEAIDDEEFDEEDLTDDDLAEEDLVADDLVADDLVEGDLATDELVEEDLTEVPVEDLAAELEGDGTEAKAVEEPVRAEKARPATDEEEDDDDVVDPDDVEEDLDTILRDRIAAGTDDEEEDEEAPVDDRSDTGDRVSPRRPEEVSCPECFLLVRRSQFSSRRTDCPGGLDGADCPMMSVFVGT